MTNTPKDEYILKIGCFYTVLAVLAITGFVLAVWFSLFILGLLWQ